MRANTGPNDVYNRGRRDKTARQVLVGVAVLNSKHNLFHTPVISNTLRKVRMPVNTALVGPNYDIFGVRNLEPKDKSCASGCMLSFILLRRIHS